MTWPSTQIVPSRLTHSAILRETVRTGQGCSGLVGELRTNSWFVVRWLADAAYFAVARVVTFPRSALLFSCGEPCYFPAERTVLIRFDSIRSKSGRCPWARS